MRTATISALLAFLLLVSFPLLASGQVDSSSPLRLSLLPKPPAFVQGSEPLNSAKSGNRDSDASSSNPMRTLAGNSVWANPFGPGHTDDQGNQRDDQGSVVRETASTTPAALETPCAHILILQRPSMDSKMAKEIPKGVGRMPVVTGLPACREDIRPQAAR